MLANSRKVVIYILLSILMVSCEDTIIGYYQGTYKSSDAIHTNGSAKMNFSQNPSGGFDITLEAVDWKLIQCSNVTVTSKSTDWGYSEYKIKGGVPLIEGTITIFGSASIKYTEGPLIINFSLSK